MYYYLFVLLVFILGLCLGSFLNVIIYRLPREGVSINHPRRSLCPFCGAAIAWYDNLPILSYLILRGRCRHCSRGISPRYPLVEFISGLLVLAVYFQSGLSLRTLAGIYFVLGLVAITFIDLDEMIIPDAITFPGMIIGVAAAIAAPDTALIGPWLGSLLMKLGLKSVWMLSLAGSLLGLVLGYGLVLSIFYAYYLWRKAEGIGGGDATLLGMVGAFLGWRSIMLTVFLGSCSALLFALIMGLRQKEFRLQMKLPFGPFLSLGALIYLFFGEALLRWYLG